VSQPLAGITTALAARYEVMTHDISSMLAENDPACGEGRRLVNVVSSTCITVTSITEKVMAHLCAEPKGASLTHLAATPDRGCPLSEGSAAHGGL
jgi:hypothetical protein